MSGSISMHPFLVDDVLSKVYYKGLPSQPPLIATTKPGPFEPPTGPEAYTIPKELSLTAMAINWSSLDVLHITSVGELSGPPIVWIGVEFGALSFQEGSAVAINYHTVIKSYGIHDYYVEIRESRIMFFNPVSVDHPIFTACAPYTATLGIPIAPNNRPWIEGTGGFYLSAARSDKNIYLVTARHVVLPVDYHDNKEYYRQNNRRRGEEVLVLGTGAFQKALANIDYEIRCQVLITHAKAWIKSTQGIDDPISVIGRKEAETRLEGLRALHQEITSHWVAKEKRVIGQLIWAPPITLSTKPGQYTLDLAVIKINPGKLDADNYHGNTINVGTNYPHQQFMDKVYLNYTSPTSFKFPRSRLVKLEAQVPESALVNSPMVDANRDPCLVVFKNGARTGTTLGRANNVSSYTRTYFAGHYQESREWPVYPTDKYSGPFSTKGDSGSCVADAYSPIGGIITGGSGATDSCDITYVTPISFIMDLLHDTKHFKNAHLNRTLAYNGVLVSR
ncbi:unnamed protein product [Tuber aestivum]|uniref:Peptidase S1 domain-containing protein n=1 Tax=Tuber aestivum TaxID=59557 RepID=A0A292PSQ2_9PEZI|nr:unnamed protein product [Tuber aestivum]